MTMYEIYEVLRESNGYTINQLIEITKGSKEELKFYLEVLTRLQMVIKTTPPMSGFISVTTFSDDEIIYKKN